jgi:hypothetical protein
MSTPREPRNPFYLLLLVVALVLAVTAVAAFVVPLVEEKASQAGEPPPPSEFRDSLRSDGWKWVVAELAVLAVLVVASMVWDHRRGLQKERTNATIPQQQPNNPPSS